MNISLFYESLCFLISNFNSKYLSKLFHLKQKESEMKHDSIVQVKPLIILLYIVFYREIRNKENIFIDLIRLHESPPP